MDLLQLLSDLSPRRPKNEAELAVNRPKNRYTNILPCKLYTSLSDELFITTRLCASAVYAAVMCPSVCPSVHHKLLLYQKG